MENKVFYQLLGKTNAKGFFASRKSSGISGNMRVAIQDFIKSFPRFIGSGRIVSFVADAVDRGLVVFDPTKKTTIFTFGSIRDLKQYLEGCAGE